MHTAHAYFLSFHIIPLNTVKIYCVIIFPVFFLIAAPKFTLLRDKNLALQPRLRADETMSVT